MNIKHFLFFTLTSIHFYNYTMEEKDFFSTNDLSSNITKLPSELQNQILIKTVKSCLHDLNAHHNNASQKKASLLTLMCLRPAFTKNIQEQIVADIQYRLLDLYYAKRELWKQFNRKLESKPRTALELALKKG